MVLTLQCFFSSFCHSRLLFVRGFLVGPASDPDGKPLQTFFFYYQIQSYIKVIILLSAKSVICFLINQNTYSSLKLACLSSIIFVPIMKLVENTRECVVAPSDPIKVGSISLNGRLI